MHACSILYIYFFFFLCEFLDKINKINDNVSIDKIIRNHNMYGAEKNVIKKAYHLCIKDPSNFFLLDLKSRDPKDRYRHGWLNFLKLKPNDSSDED